MQYFGEIHAPPDAPALELETWMTYVASANDLHPAPGRPGVNPANGKPIILRPPADAVRYVVDGELMGGFCWGPGEEHHIQISHVDGFRSSVLDRARLIAESLGCQIELWKS